MLAGKRKVAATGGAAPTDKLVSSLLGHLESVPRSARFVLGIFARRPPSEVDTRIFHRPSPRRVCHVTHAQPVATRLPQNGNGHDKKAHSTWLGRLDGILFDQLGTLPMIPLSCSCRS